jgi:hypothetical protein
MIELWRHHRIVGNALVALLVGVFLLLLLGNLQSTGNAVDAIRDSQKANQSTLHTTQDTAQLIKSCVTPGGECYERGQEQTGEAVGGINRYVVLSAACAVKIATDTPDLETISRRTLTKLVTACVQSQLDIRRAHR